MPAFAALFPDMTGQPWQPVDDLRLREDFGWGCATWIMAKRARRPAQEVLQRLLELGLQPQLQPAPRKIRSTTWTRR
jgi:hypothetical protein